MAKYFLEGSIKLKTFFTYEIKECVYMNMNKMKI